MIKNYSILFIIFYSQILIAQDAINYTYDHLNRIQSINYPNGSSISYTYDAVGNRLTQTITVNPLAPQADFTTDITSGPAPLQVTFSDASVPGSNPIISWQWDFNNDGVYDANGQGPHTYTYTSAGVYSVKLRVSDGTLYSEHLKQNYITVNYPTNHPPIVQNVIPDQTLFVGGNNFTRDLELPPVIFFDPDGDILNYTVSSSNEQVAIATITETLSKNNLKQSAETVIGQKYKSQNYNDGNFDPHKKSTKEGLNGSLLTVIPISEGTAIITITADDNRGGLISIYLNITVMPELISTFPYTQNFDASTFPGGWSQTSTISPRWTVSNSNNAGGMAYEMKATWVSGTGISRLIVGPINTSGMTGLNLEFKHYFDDYAPGVTLKIQSSSDLTNWTDEAFSFNSGGGDIGPETVNTTIGSNVGSITYVAWVIDGNHFQYDYWYVDDVSIINPLPNDVGTVSIDIPSGIGPGSYTPKATVKNYGTNPNTFTVNMTITGGYNSTKTVTNLAPGATEQVTFDNWNATLGSYTVNVCTQLAGDQNTANDCKTKQFGVFSGNWSIGSTFPDGTYLGSCVAVNGVFYSIGGNTNSGLLTECYKYDVATDTWTPIASLPEGRRVVAIAAAGNFIFVIGGSNSSSVYQSTVYKYDITADTWTTAAPLPLEIGWGKAVGYNNNKIYFAGGVGLSSNYLATVYVYDVAANTWTAATSMPGAKFGGAFSVTGNKLVYVGGASSTSITNTVYVGTIDNLDPTVISWITMEKTYPGLNKQIYSEYNGRLDEILMPDLKRITRGHLSPEAANYPPGVMFRFDGAPWGTDEIIVAGGSPTSDWVPADPNPSYRYNPTTDMWTQEADVPLPVLGASLGTVNSGNIWKLIVASGYTGSVVTNATQIYTVDMGGGGNTFALSVNVDDGWNMVSVPGINPIGMGVEKWWQYRDPLATVYKWANGANTPVTITAPTEGYWMFHSGTRTYNTGDEWPASGIQTVTHSSIPVTTGWNMFGVYEESVPAANLSTTPANLIVPGTLYSWTGTYINPTNLDPGYAYWVYVSGSGVINPPSALKGSGGGDAVLGKEISKDWGRIIISDSQGKSYTLYSVKGEVDLTHYLLPPLPPAGSFDIRYSSGHKAEDLSTDQTIDMQGLVYPITVKAEGQDIRVQDISGKLVNTGLKSGEELVIDNSSINKLMVSGTVIPDVYALEQNYPNPFNPSTIIEFSLPENVENVRLTIYSILGEKVAELVNGKLDAGKYKYTWNASNTATGMYIYELRTEKFVSVKKMLLMK